MSSTPAVKCLRRAWSPEYAQSDLIDLVDHGFELLVRELHADLTKGLRSCGVTCLPTSDSPTTGNPLRAFYVRIRAVAKFKTHSLCHASTGTTQHIRIGTSENECTLLTFNERVLRRSESRQVVTATNHPKNNEAPQAEGPRPPTATVRVK